MSRIVLASGLGGVGMPPAVEALEGDLPSLDVIEAGISAAELDPETKIVGLGGDPNMLGEVECDAAIVDGRSHNVGIVAGLKGFVEALWVARQVMERSPHVAIGGEGAALFAAEMGATRREMLTERARQDYEHWRGNYVSAELDLRDLSAPRNEILWNQIDADASLRSKEKDTVVYLARDSRGNLAAGGSTSGWAYKYPGRYGDTPLPGAGVWADNDGGACACTHTGEMTARALTAKAVVDAMRRGAGVAEAVHESVQELKRLEGGYQGRVIVHAINRDGEPYALTTLPEENARVWIWRDDTKEIQCIKPEVL